MRGRMPDSQSGSNHPFATISKFTVGGSAGSILDISKYRDTCERSISILDGIAILRYIEYRMIRRYLGDISYDPEYRPIRYLHNRRYRSIARKPQYRDTYY